MKRRFYLRLFRNRFLLLKYTLFYYVQVLRMLKKWIRVNQMGYLPNQSKVAVFNES